MVWKHLATDQTSAQWPSPVMTPCCCLAPTMRSRYGILAQEPACEPLRLAMACAPCLPRATGMLWWGPRKATWRWLTWQPAAGCSLCRLTLELSGAWQPSRTAGCPMLMSLPCCPAPVTFGTVLAAAEACHVSQTKAFHAVEWSL